MDSKTAKLLAWLEREGVSCSKLDVRTGPSGDRSVFAREDIAAREIILDLPGRLALTDEAAAVSPMGRRISEAGLQLQNDDSRFVAALLEEKHNPDSFWAPFFENLPTDFSHLPSFYTPAELRWLQGSSVLPIIEEYRQACLVDDRLLRESVPEYARFSTAEFLWGRAILNSRRFSVDINGERIEALVPGLEMLNHQLPNNVSWACAPDALHFRAAPSEVVPAGTELFVTYGEKANRKYFVNYGFVMESNVREDTALSVGVPDSVPRASLKRTLLLGRDEASLQDRFVLSHPPKPGDPPIDEELLSFLRFTVATAEEVSQVLGARMKPSAIDRLNPENEARALGMLEDACRKALARFETTIADDDALLQAGGLTYNQRNCVVVRRGEKRVLQHYIELARAGRASLSSETRAVGA